MHIIYVHSVLTTTKFVDNDYRRCHAWSKHIVCRRAHSLSQQLKEHVHKMNNVAIAANLPNDLPGPSITCARERNELNCCALKKKAILRTQVYQPKLPTNQAFHALVSPVVCLAMRFDAPPKYNHLPFLCDAPHWDNRTLISVRAATLSGTFN